MTRKLLSDAVKDKIREAIDNNPTMSADRIVGLVYEANPASVRDVAREMGHAWPERRKAYNPNPRPSTPRQSMPQPSV